MKKNLALAFAMLLSGVLVVSALAAGNGNDKVRKTDPRAIQGQSAGEGKIPQAQAETFKKREDAKERRDKLMKMRDQKIKAAEQGINGMETLPAPPK